jgi:hypothetical protein
MRVRPEDLDPDDRAIISSGGKVVSSFYEKWFINSMTANQCGRAIMWDILNQLISPIL